MKSLRSSQRIAQYIRPCSPGKVLLPGSLRHNSTENTQVREPLNIDPRATADINSASYASPQQGKLSARPLGVIPRPLKNNGLVTLRFSTGVFNKVLLRDACNCPQCVDPSSTQKNFKTTDIPKEIEIRDERILRNGDVELKWKNDIPGFGEDHVSVFSQPSLSPYKLSDFVGSDISDPFAHRAWDRKAISEELEFVNYEDYMASDKALHRALWLLGKYGLLLVRGVPESEKSVEHIANRVGNIRDTFYGRTWDVRSVPDAKNVAYTPQDLGLHMDLLYMANPPGFQLLHCLKNSAKGGSSLFADGRYIAKSLDENSRRALSSTSLAYQYKNDGEHYYYTHPVIENVRVGDASKSRIRHINYSPPFQAPYAIPRGQDHRADRAVLKALKKFADLTESLDNVLEYKMKEGECVFFNNRRVLHGRTAFDSLGGERWLKGAYLDTDVVASRLRVFDKRFEGEEPSMEVSYNRVLPYWETNPVMRELLRN